MPDVPVGDGFGVHGQWELRIIILAGNSHPVGESSPALSGMRGFGERYYLCATNIRKLWRGWYLKDDKGVIDERASKGKKKLTVIRFIMFKLMHEIIKMTRLETSDVICFGNVEER